MEVLNLSQVAEQNEVLDRARRDRRGLFNEARLLASMNDNELDGIIASSPANVTYSGGAWVPHPTLSSYIVTAASGAQGAVLNEADEFYFNEYSWIDDIRGFRFGPKSEADALRLLSELVDDLGLTRGRIGVEYSHLPKASFDRVSQTLDRAELRDGHRIFDDARLVKTVDEIELLRLAAYYTDKAIQTAFALTRPGESEKELAARMQSNVVQLGADASAHTHVHAGTHSTVVHTLSIERPMVSGEVVHVDFGAAFAGYQTDISRNAVVSSANARQREIYGHLFDIEQTLAERLRPGTRASEIFDLAQAQFRNVGLTHPWGTLGHSIGLGVHEGFEFAEHSEVLLEPGMVVCIEPSHIESGDARYHIEDTYVITDGRPALISSFAPIDEMFAIK